MLSTKTQFLSGRLKNPFASNNSMFAGLGGTFFQYNNSLQENLEILKRMFPLDDQNKIKDLLEEVENNIAMVTQILTEQQQDRQSIVCEKLTTKKMHIEDENRMLKNAIAALYKKLTKQDKQVQQLKQFCQKAKRENQDLKLQNRLLLDKEFRHCSFEEERDVF